MRSEESDLGGVLKAYPNADALHGEYGEKQIVKYASKVILD